MEMISCGPLLADYQAEVTANACECSLGSMTSHGECSSMVLKQEIHYADSISMQRAGAKDLTERLREGVVHSERGRPHKPSKSAFQNSLLVLNN